MGKLPHGAGGGVGGACCTTVRQLIGETRHTGDRQSGFYWIIAAIVVSLFVASFEAWVLLIESNR